MTIRTRLSWSFAGLLLATFVIVVALSYDELVAEIDTPEGRDEL